MGGAEEEVVLPGNTQAFTDSPIYARTNGYLKKWYVDIGTRVKAGRIAGRNRRAGTRSSIAAGEGRSGNRAGQPKLAQTTADRWVVPAEDGIVSRQETDEKAGDLNAKKAMVDARRTRSPPGRSAGVRKSHRAV